MVSYCYPIIIHFPLVSQIIINHKQQITSYWGWFWMVRWLFYVVFPMLGATFTFVDDVSRLHGHDALNSTRVVERREPEAERISGGLAPII